MTKWRRNLIERFALNSFISGDFAQAEKHFLALKKADPDRMGVDHNLGLTKLGQRQFAAAEKYFKRDLELFGETYVRARSMADLYYVWGELVMAREWYTKSRTLCEDDEEFGLLNRRIEICSNPEGLERIRASHAAFERAVQLQRDKDFAGAKAALREAVANDDTNFQAWNNLGSILTNEDEAHEEALTCFEKARSYSSLPAIVGNLEQARTRAENTGES